VGSLRRHGRNAVLAAVSNMHRREREEAKSMGESDLNLQLISLTKLLGLYRPILTNPANKSQ
jgi:hypothetical protein